MEKGESTINSGGELMGTVKVLIERGEKLRRELAEAEELAGACAEFLMSCGPLLTDDEAEAVSFLLRLQEDGASSKAEELLRQERPQLFAGELAKGEKS